MKILLLVAFIITSLTGCIGFSVSENNAIHAERISHSELALLGIDGDSKSHPNNGSKTYNKKTEWCGLTIIAIIPIPLIFPACSSSTEIIFENGKPTRKVEHYVGKGHGFVCGPLLPLIPYGDGSSPGFCTTK